MSLFTTTTEALAAADTLPFRVTLMPSGPALCLDTESASFTSDESFAGCEHGTCACADHFRHEHYMCNHQLCLERKFIVFMTEQELKQHAAREHGGDMSKAERRQALTIPINFQVCAMHGLGLMTPEVAAQLHA